MVSIREAVKTDVPSIFRLQRQMFEERSIYGFVPESEEQIEELIGPYLLAAEISDEIIGFVSGAVHLSECLAVIPEGERYLEIENLYIAPQFRKRGIGGRLVDELLKKARENGVGYASLYSAAKDVHDILEFYERHDFQSWYVRMFQKL